MIHWPLLRKTIRDARWLWLSCAACLFAFAWVHVLINSRVDMGRFAKILENIPDAWEKLAPVPFKQLMSYPARLSVLYEEPLVYMLMTIWCIARASDSVSGELGRGTMEIMLSQPVSRKQVILTPTLVTLLGIGGLVTVLWVGSACGISTTWVEKPSTGGWTVPFTGIEIPLGIEESIERVPMTTLVSPRQFLPAALNYACFGFFLCGFCTMLSAFDRYRWRTIGIMIGFYVVQMLAELLGQAVESLSWLRTISFFRAYEPVMFVSKSVKNPEIAWSWFERNAAGQIVDLGPLTCDAILLSLGTIAFVIAVTVFCRRDLPAPI
jgi:ABC-2 type transport system permease protein